VQLYGAPLLMVWIVFPAWLAYREFTGSAKGATLATVILLTQPELLFAILRGTHEKFTRGLMLLCLYLLICSLRSRQSPTRFVAFILAFYLSGYALITSNNLMATSFTVATGTALGLAWLITRRGSPASQPDNLTIRRLGYITITLFILSFVFLFYIYKPALSGFLLLESVWDRIQALLLSTGSEASNPYSVVYSLWVHPAVYLALSLADWLLLIASAVIWIKQGLNWLWKGKRPKGESELLLWVFYGAFAIQGALSIVADLSGALASNLQHRVFPSFALLAAPLVAKTLTEWRPRRAVVHRLGNASLWLGLGLIAVLSTLKATNEPLLSNKWLFYSPSEMQALDWAAGTLQERGLWLEYDERLFAAARIRNGASSLLIYPDYWENMDPATRNFLISDITRSRSLRLGLPLPIDADSLITYDNGQAQIYHQRPHTPYQP
jgi:hypothetical protein